MIMVMVMQVTMIMIMLTADNRTLQLVFTEDDSCDLIVR